VFPKRSLFSAPYVYLSKSFTSIPVPFPPQLSPFLLVGFFLILGRLIFLLLVAAAA